MRTKPRTGGWIEARTAVRAAGDRFARMIEDGDRPTAAATADWTVADTVAHVLSIANMYVTMLSTDDPPLPSQALVNQLLATNVDTVADLNVSVMRAFPEREQTVLLDRLRDAIDTILAVTRDDDPDRVVTWLGDSKVPVAGVVAHLVNELHLHGWDVARAFGVPWTIPPAEAALFLDLFLVGMIRRDYGRLLDHGRPQRAGRIAVAFHSAYTVPVSLVLDHGHVTVGPPDRDIDVRLRFDPPTLNLMLFGRVSRLRAGLSGGVFVSGRRPWLLPAFMREMYLPGSGPRERRRPGR